MLGGRPSFDHEQGQQRRCALALNAGLIVPCAWRVGRSEAPPWAFPRAAQKNSEGQEVSDTHELWHRATVFRIYEGPVRNDALLDCVVEMACHCGE